MARTENFPVAALNQEPVVANRTNPVCETENDALVDAVNPFTVGDVLTVHALYAQTDKNGGGNAQSGVAQATISPEGMPMIRGAALTSEAHSRCGTTGRNAPPPTLTGSSTVLFVQVGDDDPIINESAPRSIPIPLVGTLHLNQQFKNEAGNQITQRALFLDTAAGDIVIAESIADFHGNPCDTGNGGGGGGGNRPQCSDEIDNDGDGKIDHPNDPGCDSPQDNNETDGPPAPQCSDGKDNDGDGQVDYPADPGCDNRDDNDERDGPTECSDTIDNDVDGKRDLKDPGCKNDPRNDDEAEGFITGGGGFDEIDKQISDEDVVTPGSSVRFGAVSPCDLGDNPGPNLNVTWHDPGMIGHFKLATLTRAYCDNDPYIDPAPPAAQFDTYVGEGTGTLDTDAQDDQQVKVQFILIDRGEPGAPPVTGVDFFSVRLFTTAAGTLYSASGTLDHGNIQAHTPGSSERTR